MKLIAALFLFFIAAGCGGTSPPGYGPPAAPDAGALAGLRLVRSGFVVVAGPSAIEPWGTVSRSDAGAIVPGLKREVRR